MCSTLQHGQKVPSAPSASDGSTSHWLQCTETIPSWCSEWAQGAPGRKFCSGSVSYFRDLYSARTIPGCLLSLHPLPCCVFPTLCVWTVKEIYLKTSGTKHHRLKVCQSVCVCGWVGVKMNSISFVWMGCLFRHGAEDCILVALQTWHKVY